MKLKILKSKLHYPKVTEAQIDYIGSVTIDKDFMDAVGIHEFESVLITNKNNGNRIETYVIEGERGSKVICINGPAAKKFNQGDIVVIMAFAYLDENELTKFRPKIAIFGKDNNIAEMINK